MTLTFYKDFSFDFPKLNKILQNQIMKKIILLVFMLCSMAIQSQNSETDTCEKPFIEVVGTAKRDVIPDRIFISINLTEKTVDKKTYTIQQQENALKSIVKSLNIGMDKLSLSDSNSYILYKKKREKGVVLSKEYQLEVSNPQQLNSVFESLNNSNIKEASIIRTEHSEIIQIRKEVRIEAIKAAKEKAEYLLEAIDEELGMAIEISERTSSNYLSQSINRDNRANSSYSYDERLNNLNFKTIEVRFSYYVRYRIKEK